MRLSATEHETNGRYIKVGSNNAFIYEKGNGENIVCFHGVPASSYLYRKIIHQLSGNGFRGISYDLLGMGLSDKPNISNYTWSGLGTWSTELLKKLDLKKFHVVLHDIGGPIACEVMNKIPEQIKSVTILNTILVNLSTFEKPFPMNLFATNTVGNIMLALTNTYSFLKLMHLRGIHKNDLFTIDDANAYLEFLKREDNGKSFLKIMQGFESTEQKENLYLNILKELQVPIQVIWGKNDKGLTFNKYGKPLIQKLKISNVTQTNGSHFLQEDFSQDISNQIIDFIKNHCT